MSIDVQNLNIQGIKINYYFICKRKLWLFSKGITMEQENDRVISGKIIHENSYKREKNKELLIDNLIRLDIVNKDYVREIKISSKMENADKMQLYYYLYYLKRLGINKKGILNYVKERKIEEIELTEEKIIEIENIILEIQKIESQKTPPKLKKLSYCTKYAYYEFCFAKEEE
ncbi:CRISPR-associated protein Cas4 [Intestinibacter bartlettii]|uniref:CRISPR-associated protein Cas4 n=1 Tax=Intestinibacter bartlettii TaxID=261299 RepID=UPI0006C38D91|nr:CRISPR-associated protein Cas4 [Intestinibacter bartlettii]CUP17415.1 CRISPR-associated Cas4 family protein [Intestinibacter bartlettii]